MKIPLDTSDFLEALIFAQPEDAEINDRSGHSIFDFSPEFIAAVDRFITGFRTYLDTQNFDSDRLDELNRSFGGNVYFSLSGHGCGFWDERSDTAGDELQGHLEKYAGGKYHFESLDIAEREDGKIDCAFLPEYLEDSRAKMFAVAVS